MQLPGRNQSDGTAGSPGNPTGRLRIEAENFSGRQDVETEPCGDLGGTLNVGYIDVGNFITYDVTAPVSGMYTINFRVANGGPTSSFQLRDSISQVVLATITVPYTGGWQNYITMSATATLPAGQQTLQLLCTSNNWNLNWLELLPPGTGSGGYNGNGAYHIEAEDFISQNGTLLENCLDGGGTYNIGSIDNGDWLDYRINMPVGGSYQFSLRAASANGSNSVQLRTQSGTVLATLNVTNTGGYQTYNTFTGSVILPAGVQTLRLQVTGGYMAVNWLELSAPPGAPPLDNYALIVNENANNSGGLIYEAENNFTVEFWVKPSGQHEVDGEATSGTSGTYGQKYVIFPAYGGDVYESRAGMGISVGTNGVSVYEHAAGYMPPLLAWQGAMTEWTHVAVVYNNGRPSLYINGVWVKDGLQSPKQHVHPGTQFPGGFYGSQANGQLDEVRIWSVARTQAQIAANMTGELPPTNTGLQGYWPMNEGMGAVLHDVSGSGRNIDLTSAGYSGANWTNGRYSITTTTSGYRYGFNGQERSTEIGEDDYTAMFWEYDSRIGRRWNVDPETKDGESSYMCFSGSPILFSDLLGNQPGDPKTNKKSPEQVNLTSSQTSAAIHSALFSIHTNTMYKRNYYVSSATPENKKPYLGNDLYGKDDAKLLDNLYGIKQDQVSDFVKVYKNYYNNFATIGMWFDGSKTIAELFKAMEQVSTDDQYKLANSFINDFVAKNARWQQLSEIGVTFGNILLMYGGQELQVGKGIKAPFKSAFNAVAAKGEYLVKIGAVEDDVMMFSSKIRGETVEGITNFAVKDGKLYLNQLHLQGSSAGNVGREALWNMAKDLGKQYHVKEVIIQGGRRTTGKYKGQVPSPITITVD